MCRYAALAASSGVRSFIRVPTLGLEPEFIDALASVVMEALPDLNQPSMQQVAEIHRDIPRYTEIAQPSMQQVREIHRDTPTCIPTNLHTYHRSTRGTRWRSTS